jgi:hypothetical protein
MAGRDKEAPLGVLPFKIPDIIPISAISIEIPSVGHPK